MTKVFNKVGIIYNSDFFEAEALAKIIQLKIDNSKVSSIDNFLDDIDLAVIIGGDGTFLKAARHYCKNDIPILGFNIGRLGYLAQAKPQDVDFVIEKLNNNNFEIENRLMLKSCDKTALNDIVIKGTNCSRSATLDLFINDKKLCSYVADGLIISTPTGTTAYSLSAGGPIVSPMLDCFLIIPICPHTLNMRPLIIPSSEKIRVSNHEKDANLNISFDGQNEVISEVDVVIEKNENCAKLLILDKQKDKFYDILKEKLHWSLSPKK